MKKNLLFMSMLASLFMVGCSQDEIAPNEEDNSTGGETQTSYMSVNLVSSDATRADGPFENGTDAENKVEKVRFYFLTGSGAPANVKLQSGSYVNYYDWTPGNGDQTAGTNGENVGSKLKATLVIETPKGDKLPTQIVAVINPVETAKSRSLTDLKGLTKDYASSGYTTGGTFVMFNSVYGNSGKTAEVCAVPIKEVNLAKTSADAINNPVIIHVERCVAKVTVTMDAGFDETTKLLPLKSVKKGQSGNDVVEDLTVGGEQVYLKINGWKLAAETTTGNLVKAIDIAAWENSTIKDWWNSYSNKRSCWAVNSSDAENRYWSYNEITPTSADYIYTNENAEHNPDGNQLNPTKVILSGTLCHGDGTPFTIVRHLGTLFADTYSETETSNLLALKRNILAQLTADTKYYWKDGETFKSIAEGDLKIVSVGTDGKEDEPAHDCFVYAQLTDEAAAKTWYTTDTDGATALENGSGIINENLKNSVDQALVWNSGMTYYYYEIIHNIDNGGNKTIGVVRNHVYKTTVTKIAGLGTPVYDPDQKIYPEKPDPNDHYIAAQINILAWHIVSNNYELTW